jgi:hypothetical protein
MLTGYFAYSGFLLGEPVLGCKNWLGGQLCQTSCICFSVNQINLPPINYVLLLSLFQLFICFKQK